MPGVYTYGKIADENGVRTIKPVTKIRGGDAKKYAAKVKANQWLIENVLAAWRKPFDPRNRRRSRASSPSIRSTSPPETPLLRRPMEARRPVDGQTRRAGAGKREIFVHSVGNKRELIPDEVSGPITSQSRPRGAPLPRAYPHDAGLNNDPAISRPRMPEWLDKGIGREVEDGRSRRRLRRGLSNIRRCRRRLPLPD